MTKTNKTLLTLIFAGLLTICAGFALLLSRPAAQAKAEGTETKEYVESLEYGEAVSLVAESDNENERNYELPLDTWTLINNTDFKVRLLVNGEQIVSIGSPIDEWTTTEGVSYFLENQYLGYLKFDSKKINSVYLKRYLPKDIKEGVLIDESCNFLKISKPAEAPVKYTLTFKDGENILGTAEAVQGDKLSALDISAISTTKEGYTFKGWSYTENGDVLDLEAETVTENKTLYAVYEKNAEPTEPTDPANPTNPENPDKNFEDKVKDFGDKASEWIEKNVGLSISGGAVIVILIAAAILIFSKRR